MPIDSAAVNLVSYFTQFAHKIHIHSYLWEQKACQSLDLLQKCFHILYQFKLCGLGKQEPISQLHYL